MGATAMPDALTWERQGPYHWSGPGGCRVSACRVVSSRDSRENEAETAMGWRFTAWGPEALPALNYWQWREAANLPERYERGQDTPQRRPWLGVFTTAEAARAACLTWLERVEAGEERYECANAVALAAMAREPAINVEVEED